MSKISLEAPDESGIWLAGGQAWINLVNTQALAGKGLRDALWDDASLDWWLDQAGVEHSFNPGPADLEFVRALRTVLGKLVEAVAQRGPMAQGDIELINEALAHSRHFVELGWHSGRATREEVRPMGDIRECLAPTLEEMVDTLANRDSSRLRQCAHPDCSLWFYDDSKNGKRKWCTMSGCGNRSKAAAFLERKRR